jgi:hypothetical protein
VGVLLARELNEGSLHAIRQSDTEGLIVAVGDATGGAQESSQGDGAEGSHRRPQAFEDLFADAQNLFANTLSLLRRVCSRQVQFLLEQLHPVHTEGEKRKDAIS